MYEIERKFLVSNIPNLNESVKKTHIVQAYLCVEPVIRIRKANDKYYLTYKSKGLLIREEYNMPLTKESFESLLKKCDGKIIDKYRYNFLLDDDLTAELDIFNNDLSGLVLVEVEFKDEQKALAFKKPSWFGKEVTNDSRYQNSNMIQG